MSRFFNTLSGKVDEFKPLREGEVGIYTCGPTVYDYAHIGNFRAFVFEDLLRRYLETTGLEVKHVMNLTDVDDKTIAGANREHKSLNEYTEFYTQAFLEDLRILNILPPTVQPRATREIAGMILLIEKLIAAKIAYESEGSVYYRVAAFPGYGKLSKKKLESNIEGARVDVDEYDKEQGADFVLWKKSKEGEPYWDSPWGKGRPGWHIECSVMSMKYLGETFDIHAGGEDLIFPHHENEIAQSEAATGKPFVNYWLHCKFLLVNGEKMSKSKGNFYTLRDLLGKGHDPMAIRYLLLSTHYRSPLNFTLEGLKEAGETVKKLDECYFQCLSFYDDKHRAAGAPLGLARQLDSSFHKMLGWLADDLNVSGALTELLAAVTLVNKECPKASKEDLSAALEFFRKVDVLLGFDVAFVERVPADVMTMMAERLEVRRHPDFKTDRAIQKKSDEMRASIEKTGWLVKDARPGEPSTVKKKRRVWD